MRALTRQCKNHQTRTTSLNPGVLHPLLEVRSLNIARSERSNFLLHKRLSVKKGLLHSLNV